MSNGFLTVVAAAVFWPVCAPVDVVLSRGFGTLGARKSTAGVAPAFSGGVIVTGARVGSAVWVVSSGLAGTVNGRRACKGDFVDGGACNAGPGVSLVGWGADPVTDAPSPTASLATASVARVSLNGRPWMTWGNVRPRRLCSTTFSEKGCLSELFGSSRRAGPVLSMRCGAPSVPSATRMPHASQNCWAWAASSKPSMSARNCMLQSPTDILLRWPILMAVRASCRTLLN